MAELDITAALAAQRKLEYLYDDPNVTGVGISSRDGQAVLKVLLVAAVDDMILPDNVDGVPVISEVVGVIRPLAD